MYITNKRCTPAGPFSAPLVVTMRSMAPDQAVRAVQVATRFHLTHGAPVHLGDPEKIGIHNMVAPDFGDPVTIQPGKIPAFRAYGVTSQLVATSVPLTRVITFSKTRSNTRCLKKVGGGAIIG